MDFWTRESRFENQRPLKYTGSNLSGGLVVLIRQTDEAERDDGLRYLRSLYANVVRIPAFAVAKPIYHALNKRDFGGAVAHAKHLLSQTYESAEEHFASVQAAAFIKKYPFPGDDDLRRENATRKFLRGERRNRHFNALLRARRRREAWDTNLVLMGGQRLDKTPFVEHARQFIRRVVGDSPKFHKMVEDCRWGPGAVVGVNGQFINFARKFLSEEWTVTPAAIPYALTAAKRFPMFWEILGLEHVVSSELRVLNLDSDLFEQRFRARLKVVDYNKVAFVPKDCDCDRTIASEPLLNQWLQLGVDADLKVRLRRVKIDLRYQGPNQELARAGSLGGLNPYCTIDLKNASGSIYTELVRELLPPGWFTMLNALRSPSWRMDNGDPVKYHGFVSMGNGYCFPLETLIFASICSAAHAYTRTNPDFRVYGDDIILRQNESGVVQEYLRYFGFELNPDKSFFFGPFRESCGADWYSGKPVRPVYLDDLLALTANRVRAYNAISRLPDVRVAGNLAACCSTWFKPFMAPLVRPAAADTDEAIDGRFDGHALPEYHLHCVTLQCRAWYGMSFQSVIDREVEAAMSYDIAYRYAVLSGSNSEKPFAARRETRMSVKRFIHGGGAPCSPMSTTAVRLLGATHCTGHLSVLRAA